MIGNKVLTVDKADLPRRLDKYILSKMPSSTRSFIVDAILKGDILLNGRKAPKGRQIKAGDEVLIKRLMESSDIKIIPNNKIKLDIIHEDEDIIVLNKPAGIPVHPIKPEEMNTLVNGLIAYDQSLADIGAENPLFPAFVHRLDNDTSGVIIAAKNQKSYDYMRDQFKRKKVRKVYLALVHGDVKKGGKLNNYMAHDPRDDRKMIVLPVIAKQSRKITTPKPLLQKEGKRLRTVTSYKVIKRYGNKTLLEVEIKTGVMHQIRCQFADLGHPVVGDIIYAKHLHESLPKSSYLKVDSGGINRHFLHAQKVFFFHPFSKKIVEYDVCLPEDLQKNID